MGCLNRNIAIDDDTAADNRFGICCHRIFDMCRQVCANQGAAAAICRDEIITSTGSANLQAAEPRVYGASLIGYSRIRRVFCNGQIITARKYAAYDDAPRVCRGLRAILALDAQGSQACSDFFCFFLLITVFIPRRFYNGSRRFFFALNGADRSMDI